MRAKRLFWVMAVSALVLVAAVAQGQVPQLINYQGQLTDASGNPTNGTVTMIFKIFDVASGGTALYTETQSVTVSKGVFNVLLGSVTPIPLTLFDSGSGRFLEMSVNGTVLTPRRQFGSVAYAFATRATGSGLCCTLDQSYDAGGPGAGRTITADAGAVNIAGSGGLTVNGNVGIGATSPGGKLHVEDAEWSAAPLLVKGRSGGVVGPAITMDATDGTSGRSYSIISTNSGAGAGGNKLAIYDNTLLTGGYRFVLDSGGNVGIGTTSPNPANVASWGPVLTIGPSSGNKAAIVELEGNPLLASGGGVGALSFRYAASSSADKRLGQIQVNPDGANNSGYMRFESTNNGVLSERMRITKDGNVGIGTTSPFTKLTLNGSLGFPNATSPMMYIYESGTGNAERPIVSHSPTNPNWGLSYRDIGNLMIFQASGTPVMAVNLGSNRVGIGNPAAADFTRILTIARNSTTDPIADAWTVYSSRRWKTNIRTVDGALAKVQRLRGVYYDWKVNGKHDLGLIAEEVGEVVPEIVTYEENGKDATSVDYSRLVALLIEAVKEQQKEIADLKATVKSLAAAKQRPGNESVGE